MKHILLLTCLLSATIAFSQDFSKLDGWLDRNVSSMGGRAILVIYKDGKIVYSHAENEMSRRQKMVGRFLAKRQGKKANTENYTLTTQQPIASCSKWLSAALVMTFVDEGRLHLNDTVGKFLPALSTAGKGGITISQCLSHLTGIKTPSLQESLKEMRGMNSMDDAIAEIAGLPMEGEPGKVFRYSNAGLQIAGAVIEKISGRSFEQLFAERIAKPLDMKNTDFGETKVALPAGGARSTPEDYTHFLAMILNRGSYNGKTVLSEQSIAAMQVNRITKEVRVAYTPTEAGNFGYGFGEWVMDTNSNGQTQSVSSPGLFGSFPWVDNNRKYTGFLMTYHLKNDGRHARYKELMQLVAETLP